MSRAARPRTPVGSPRPRPVSRGRRAGAALVATLGAVGPLGGCGDDAAPTGPRLRVTDAFLARPVTEEAAGGFLTVRNGGDQPDRLTSVDSDLAAEVELHRTSGNRMREVSSLPVPAHGELRLRRGGDHLMFVKLRRLPAEGETVTVTLRFAESAPITRDIPVKATHHVPDHAMK